MILRDRKGTVTEDMLLSAGVPKKFWYLQPAGYPDGYREAVIQVLDSIPGRLETPKGVFIVGPPNRGKTAAACMMLRVALQCCASSAFVYFNDEEINYAQQSKKIGELARVDFLVIDSLGEPVGTHFAFNRFAQLLRARCDDMRLTVMTSSCSAQSIENSCPAFFVQQVKKHAHKRLVLDHHGFGEEG